MRHLLYGAGAVAGASDTVPRHIINWWVGPVTHGDVFWIGGAVVLTYWVASFARGFARVWGERIRVRKLPGGALDVRITGTTDQIEAAMAAWLSRGKDGRI